MPPKKTPPPNPRIDPPEQVAADPDIDPITAQPPDPTVDPFETLFAPDAGGAVVVQLRRDWPDRLIDPKTGQEIKVSGYLEDLPPNIDSYEAYIQARYGGGNYLAQKKVAGRIRTQAAIKIAGPSRFPSDISSQPTTSEPPAPKTLTPGGPAFMVDGVPIPLSGPFEDVIRFAISLKALKQFFPDPPPPRDINDTLLAFALKGNAAPDLGKLVEQFTAVSEALHSLPGAAGDGGGEMNWAGLLAKAVDTIPALIAQAQNTRRAPALTPPTVRPVAGVHPGALPENVPENPTVQPAKEENLMPMQLTLKDKAQVAVAHLVSGFLPESPSSATDMVALLDNVLELDRESRAKLVGFKTMLWTLAKGQFCEKFESGPELIAEFQAFFDQVFDEYVRADREVRLLV